MAAGEARTEEQEEDKMVEEDRGQGELLSTKIPPCSLLFFRSFFAFRLLFAWPIARRRRVCKKKKTQQYREEAA